MLYRESAKLRKAARKLCGPGVTAHSMAAALELRVVCEVVVRETQGQCSCVPHGMEPRELQDPIFRVTLADDVGCSVDVVESHMWLGGFNSGHDEVETQTLRDYEHDGQMRAVARELLALHKERRTQTRKKLYEIPIEIQNEMIRGLRRLLGESARYAHRSDLIRLIRTICALERRLPRARLYKTELLLALNVIEASNIRITESAVTFSYVQPRVSLHEVSVPVTRIPD